ncbi:MAG: ABC transporter ATP-binding protein [Planctomycetota bacterium]|nr:ABC transporter ATP-binding protein [Planctomycetota bacterium]
MNAIDVKNLRKHYDGHLALDGLDWSLPVGEACALLGPNGAGKSTTLRLLMGFAQPSEGTLRILGSDPWDHDPDTRRRVAYVPEHPMLPSWMRVDALVDIHRSLYPAWDRALEARLRDLLEIPGRSRLSELSKGQNRRAHLMLALAQSPELLLLDEPGSGLDVAARRELLGLLAEFLAEGGRTVVLSTHLVTDVERIASRVLILAGGRAVADEELDELKDEVKLLRLSSAAWRRLAAGMQHAGILTIQDQGPEVIVTLRRFRSVADALLRRDLGEGGVIVSESAAADVYVAKDGTQAQALHLSLEDVFLALTEPTLSTEAAWS